MCRLKLRIQTLRSVPCLHGRSEPVKDYRSNRPRVQNHFPCRCLDSHVSSGLVPEVTTVWPKGTLSRFLSLRGCHSPPRLCLV